MKTSAYWKKRVELLEEANHADATKYANEISNIYDSATRELEGQLTKWYTRYANEEGITLAEAKRLLNTRELEEFRMDVHEYIKKGRSLDPQWAKQLEGASVRVHVSRLEALKVQTQQLAERVKGEVADTFDEFAIKTYSDQYYKTIFEIQKGAGIGFDITKLDEKRLQKVINKPWAVDGKNFSQRIWGDRTKLVNELHQTLSKGIIQGKAPQKVVKELSERMGVSKSATARLVYTESSFFANQATLDSYKELGVEEYEILATLDTRTSPLCQKMDGQKFNVKEMEVGVNYPPFHVYCRTTTVPYFDDEFDIKEERAARSENGKYYTVPSSMKYPEWFEKFVGGGSKKGLVEVTKNVFESKMNEFKEQLSQSYEQLDTKQSEVKQLMTEKRELENDIVDLNWEKDRVIPYNEKALVKQYERWSPNAIDKELKHAKDDLEKLLPEYNKLDEQFNLYYDRGDMDRAEWREWKRNLDFDELNEKYTNLLTKKNKLERNIRELEKLQSPEFQTKVEGYKKKLAQLDADIASKSNQLDSKLNALKDTKDSIEQLKVEIDNSTREAGKMFIENMDMGDYVGQHDTYKSVVAETRRLAKEATDAGELYKKSKIPYDEYLKKYSKWKVKYDEMHNLKSDLVSKNIELVKDNLKKVRPIGTPEELMKEMNTHLGIKSKASLTDARQSVLNAYDCYPTEWIEKSVKHSNLQISKTGRGYYKHSTFTLKTSGNTPTDLLETSIHELGHRFERTQGLLSNETVFYARRTKGESLEWLGKGFRNDEMTKKDNFLDPYIGKDYGGSAYEVVSMGFQYAYTDLGLLLEDEDFAQFIFGLLSTR